MYNIQIHPEYIKLTEKLTILKEELSSKIEEHDDLIKHTLPAIEAEYQLKIGYKVFEKFNLECEIRRIRRKIQLIQALINNDKPVVIELIEQQLDEELKEWQNIIDQMLKEYLEAQIRFQCNCLTAEESKELKQLYRKLVFLLHPDINPDISENDKQLWYQVVEAYKNCDLDTLKTLYMIINDELDVNTEKLSSIDRIKELCSKLKDKIILIIKEIQNLHNSFPYDIAIKLNDDTWVSLQVNQINKDIQLLLIEKSTLESILQEFCV